MKAFPIDHFFQHAKHACSKLSSSVDMYRQFFFICMIQWQFKAHFLTSHLEMENYLPSLMICSLITCGISNLIPQTHVLTYVSSIYTLHLDFLSQRPLVPPFQYLMVQMWVFPLGKKKCFLTLSIMYNMMQFFACFKHKFTV